MNFHNNYALILLGQTASGKSSLSEKLAIHFDAEIINMDIGSFYTPLTIGTAKAKNSQIHYHMVDVIDAPYNLNVVEYRERVVQALHDIWARKKLPILVGGSGFYLKSLFFQSPPMVQKPLQEPKKQDAPQTVSTWQELNAIDPLRAQNIHPHDTYRIERALEIWRLTQLLPSSFDPLYSPISRNFDIVYLTRNQDDLHARIQARIDEMVQQGLPEEVFSLYQDRLWRDFLMVKKIIGYNDFFDSFEKYGNDNKEQWLPKVIQSIGSRTRAYAKRQRVFWKMLKNMLQKAGYDQAQEINMTIESGVVAFEKIKEVITKKNQS